MLGKGTGFKGLRPREEGAFFFQGELADPFTVIHKRALLSCSRRQAGRPGALRVTILLMAGNAPFAPGPQEAQRLPSPERGGASPCNLSGPAWDAGGRPDWPSVHRKKGNVVQCFWAGAWLRRLFQRLTSSTSSPAKTTRPAASAPIRMVTQPSMLEAVTPSSYTQLFTTV